MPTDRLFTSPEALKRNAPDATAEVLTIFPKLFSDGDLPKPTRPIPAAKRQKKRLERTLEKYGHQRRTTGATL